MKNVAASVRARLGNRSKAEGQTLDFLIERFAMGRLFWRLSRSPYANLFVLKGAQLFGLWEGFTRTGQETGFPDEAGKFEIRSPAPSIAPPKKLTLETWVSGVTER